MPRTLKEILEHADEIAEQFEDYEPDPANRQLPGPLKSLRAAVQARAAAERQVADAVGDMRLTGYSWSTIGMTLGTTSEAARQRYAESVAQYGAWMKAADDGGENEPPRRTGGSTRAVKPAASTTRAARAKTTRTAAVSAMKPKRRTGSSTSRTNKS